jgi:hypothetical protein
MKDLADGIRINSPSSNCGASRQLLRLFLLSSFKTHALTSRSTMGILPYVNVQHAVYLRKWR